MNQPSSHYETLLDLEARHDNLLAQLDELDKRVEKVLGDWLSREAPVREGLPVATALAH
jgi:hypothetical protein